jgi:hypothetical protein
MSLPVFNKTFKGIAVSRVASQRVKCIALWEPDTLRDSISSKKRYVY